MSARAAKPALPPLLPEPRRIERRPGSLRLRNGLPLVLAPDATAADFASACALRDAVREACGVALAVETHARTEDLGTRIELAREGEVGQAYRLRVRPERVEAVGSGSAGLRYATETLAQLVDRRARLPACEVDDAPELPRRGLMLDVSRGKVPSYATLRGLVDLCVRLKLNVLMLYVEHTFRFRRHPEIGSGAWPLDAETVRRLDRYAAERHVELVPNLQSLGHMEHVLSIPRYADLAETERRWTLSPVAPGTYDLLRDLYDEYLPNFRSGLFNANCDEPFDLGRGRAAARTAELGPGGVFLEHVRRVRDLAAAHGKRTLIWADFVHAHPERLDEVDRDLVMLDWWYEAEFDYDRVAVFAERGLEFWVCPGTSGWNALFPRLENALVNVSRWAAAGRRHGARGLLLTDWGDFGHANPLGGSWLACAHAAQEAWSGPADAARFDRAFGRVLFGEASAEPARLYRGLGALHDAGFAVFNASVLQLLYFDDVQQAFFLRAARAGPARRTLARVEALRRRIAAARARFARDPVTHAELALAADASGFALRKTLAGLDALAWRARPERLGAGARRRLAGRLAGLAAEQRGLGRRLRRLWLARSAPSNFELTAHRLERSIRSLRRAARDLERNRPAPPPPPAQDFRPPEVLRELRRSIGRE